MLNLFRYLIYFALLLRCFNLEATEQLTSTSFYNNFTITHFVDQNNKPFQPLELMGKVALFNFVYTQCSNTCPIQTKQLVEVYSSFPKEYQDKIVFVTVSLDSQFDKPKVLKKYAKKMNAEFKQWQFLTGSYEDIKSLQDNLFLFGNPKNPAHPKVDITQLKTTKKDEVLKNHMAILWVVDKHGMIMQRYSANPMDVPRIEAELKQIVDLP